MSKTASIIRNAAVSLGIPYKELSMKTEIPENTIRRFITGLTKELPVDDLMKLCRAIEVSPFGSTSYKELAAEVRNHEYLRTREDVMSWLIGYQGAVATQDMLNLNRLVKDGLVIW